MVSSVLGWVRRCPSAPTIATARGSRRSLQPMRQLRAGRSGSAGGKRSVLRPPCSQFAGAALTLATPAIPRLASRQ